MNNWTPDRPTKPGKYWLSVHPDKRPGEQRPDVMFPHAIACEVTQVVEGMLGEDNANALDHEQRRFVWAVKYLSGGAWLRLSDPWFAGAQWHPYVEPPDPFAEPVPPTSTAALVEEADALSRCAMELEQEVDKLITQRDRWEEQVGDMAASAGCEEEFSNWHDHKDCVEECVAVLKTERDAARAELGRLTTPRPIAEAPRDGTRILAYMPSTETWMVLVWLVRKEYWACPDFPHVGYYDPSHYLPLPEVAQRRGIAKPVDREGIVLHPLIELRANDGERLVAKFKGRMFSERKTFHDSPEGAQRTQALSDAETIAEEWVTDMRLTHVLQHLRASHLAFPGWQVSDCARVAAEMLADVLREAEGEVVASKEAERAIKRRAVALFQARLKGSAT